MSRSGLGCPIRNIPIQGACNSKILSGCKPCSHCPCCAFCLLPLKRRVGTSALVESVRRVGTPARALNLAQCVESVLPLALSISLSGSTTRRCRIATRSSRACSHSARLHSRFSGRCPRFSGRCPGLCPRFSGRCPWFSGPPPLLLSLTVTRAQEQASVAVVSSQHSHVLIACSLPRTLCIGLHGLQFGEQLPLQIRRMS